MFEASNLPKIAVNPARRRNAISLTPLIDVVFILLIFFMLASSFLDWRAIPMTTAKAPPANTVSTKQAWTLSVNGATLLLNKQPMPMGVIVQTLESAKDQDPELAVRIQPIGGTSLQSLITVLDQLTERGFTKLNFVRDPNWQPDSKP
ncbi:MAG: biopolymer transporter ExbD [Pseudomonadota bacterium]